MRAPHTLEALFLHPRAIGHAGPISAFSAVTHAHNKIFGKRIRPIHSDTRNTCPLLLHTPPNAREEKWKFAFITSRLIKTVEKISYRSN